MFEISKAVKLNMSLLFALTARRFGAKTRYETLRSSKLKFGKLLNFGLYQASSSLIHKNDLEAAFRLHAEVCIANGSLFSSKKWKERVLFAGALSAYLGDIDRASNWLAAGVELQKSSLLARSKTYGFPEEFVSWAITHQSDISTPEGWRSIFSRCDTSDRAEALLLYILCLSMAMGLTPYVKPLLTRPISEANNALRQALLNRANKKFASGSPIFGQTATLTGDADEVSQRIACNISGRLFDSKDPNVSPISRPEFSWLESNQNRLPYSDPGFHEAALALRLIVNGDFAACQTALSTFVCDNRAIIAKLDARSGPKKLFIGGFGWSGSGAVFDALRGYPSVDEMPGPKSAPHLNEGADTEPMLYQGPAGIMELSREFLRLGVIRPKTWRKFFDLQVLAENQSDYFEYKTVWANRNLREIIGPKTYYVIINQLLFDYASYQISLVSAERDEHAIGRERNLNSDIFILFGQRIVNALFPNDESTVLFNNAINTHKLEALKFAGGRSSYISVDRSILDQMADQRKNNVFFRFGAFHFTLYKFKKLHDFRKNKQSVCSAEKVQFIETTFERWVGSREHRKDITERLIGVYDETYESRHFQPEVSKRNVGISKKILSALEIRVLTFFQMFVR